MADRYRLIRSLGSGASKDVYLARDQRLDRDVALALLRGEAQEEHRTRLLREAQTMARLGDHPRIVTIYDIGEDDGVPYLVARYMSGGSLAERLDAAPDRRLEPREAVRLATEIAQALAHAHGRGVVHRDVKPSNVWLGADGGAALGDFGIARSGGDTRLTLEGSIVGSALYLSPEQARGQEVDPRSDLYSLGVTLYELVTGAPPFEGASAIEVVARHLEEAPTAPSQLNPDVAPGLERLVLALLAKRPEDRPPSAEATATALAVADHAVRLGDSASAPAAAPPSDLIGRSAERRRGHAALRAAMEGDSRFVAITGEPGVGKTRLARELADDGERLGAAVVTVTCAQEEGTPAYWVWTHVLRRLPRAVRNCPPLPDEVARLLPESAGALEEPANPEEARFQLFDGVARMLERVAAQQPLVLVFDDLQWADRLSIRLLRHVVRHLGHARTLIVACYRAGALERGAPLRDLGDLAARSGSVTFELSGLRQDEVRRFVERTAGVDSARLAHALAEHTGGNVFYLAESVRMLQAEGRLAEAERNPARLREWLPATIRHVVGRRLDRLGLDAEHVLYAAAVQGAEFHPDVLAEATSLPLMTVFEALERARTLHLVEEVGGTTPRWAFSHAIVRDAIAADLAPSHRAQLHAGIGQALERRPRESAADASELARHFVAATSLDGSLTDRAVAYSCEAAEQATQLFAYAEAAEHYERAEHLLERRPSTSAAQRCDVLLALADAHTRAGDAEEGRRIFLRAADRARELEAPDRLARAALGYAEWAPYGADNQTSVRLLDDALARLGSGASSERALMLGRLASRLTPEDQERREQLLDEALAIARGLGDHDVLATLLAISLLVNWGPERAPVRRTLAAEAIELATASGDRQGALWAHVVRFLDALSEGETEKADAELEAYEQIAGQGRRPYYRWYLLVLRATRLGFSGDIEPAERNVTEAFAVIRRLEEDSGQEYAVQRFMLARLRGSPADAPADALRAFAERYPQLPLWRAMLAALEADLGRLAHARRALEVCTGEGVSCLRRDDDWLSRLVFLADACVEIGDVQRAPMLYALLAPYADRNAITERGWAAWGAVARPLGRLAALAGEPAAAARHFERALELHERWGAHPWIAHTVYDYARATGSPDALARVGAALELCSELGLDGLAGRLRAL